MPQVGKKNFAYTPGGIAKARREERISGNPMVQNEPKGQNYQGGVSPQGAIPQNPNNQAVNQFMNRSAIEDKTGPMAPKEDTAKLQAGLNKLYSMNQGYEPLKVDGEFGPKTKKTADAYLGRQNKRRV